MTNSNLFHAPLALAIVITKKGFWAGAIIELESVEQRNLQRSRESNPDFPIMQLYVDKNFRISKQQSP
jgi:hypothetical protein